MSAFNPSPAPHFFLLLSSLFLHSLLSIPPSYPHNPPVTHGHTHRSTRPCSVFAQCRKKLFVRSVYPFTQTKDVTHHKRCVLFLCMCELNCIGLLQNLASQQRPDMCLLPSFLRFSASPSNSHYFWANCQSAAYTVRCIRWCVFVSGGLEQANSQG